MHSLRVRFLPQMQQDAILKVTSTAICGSDLHMYVGAMPGMTKGDLLGHEVRDWPPKPA